MPLVAISSLREKGTTFEASSVIAVDGAYYAVCDSSWAISKFGLSLTQFSDDNIMIGNPNPEEEESGYGALSMR